jgi:hypothetical protein
VRILLEIPEQVTVDSFIAGSDGKRYIPCETAIASVSGKMPPLDVFQWLSGARREVMRQLEKWSLIP